MEAKATLEKHVATTAVLLSPMSFQMICDISSLNMEY